MQFGTRQRYELDEDRIHLRTVPGTGLLGHIDRAQRRARRVYTKVLFCGPVYRIREWLPYYRSASGKRYWFTPAQYITLVRERLARSEAAPSPWPEKPRRRFLHVPLEEHKPRGMPSIAGN